MKHKIYNRLSAVALRLLLAIVMVAGSGDAAFAAAKNLSGRKLRLPDRTASIAPAPAKLVRQTAKAAPRRAASADILGYSYPFSIIDAELYQNYAGVYLDSGEKSIFGWGYLTEDGSNPSLNENSDLVLNPGEYVYFWGTESIAVEVVLTLATTHESVPFGIYGLTSNRNIIEIQYTETMDGNTYTVDSQTQTPGILIYAQEEVALTDFKYFFYIETVNAPTFSPSSGTTFQESLTVDISADSGCTIYYTSDGSIPTTTDDCLYTGPVTLSSTTTLKAMAVSASGISSNVVSAEYIKAYTYTVYLDEPIWDQVNTYIWDNYTMVEYADSWPGSPMTKISSTDTGILWQYILTTTDELLDPMIIFNNGSGTEQTEDLIFINAHTYSRGISSPDNKVPSQLYVMGHFPEGQWLPNVGIEMTRNGNVFTASGVTIETATGEQGSFAFVTALGSTDSDWDTVNSSPRYGASYNDAPVSAGETVEMVKSDDYGSSAYSWAIAPGTYDIVADFDKMTMTVTNTPVLVNAPVFTPAASTFRTSVTVSISADPGCTIYYTADGTTPTATEKCAYTGPLTLSSTTTLKAIAVDASGNSSRVTTATYASLYGIGEGYDPVSPPDPTAPGETKKNPKLYLASNPVGACDFNYVSPTEFEEGSTVYLSAYSNGGWKFVNWTIEGEEASTEQGFRYVMPAYDVTLVANFVYDPNSPSDPQVPTVNHPVVMRSYPSGACEFSPGESFSMAEGEERYLYAYPQNGFSITRWYVNGEEVTSSSSDKHSITVTMGEKALDILVECGFSPTSPGSPGANYWNPTTGQLIIDDFTEGGLHSAINALIDGNYTSVSALIVKGAMSRSDIGTIAYFTNTETIDLSRTSGIASVPSYAFESLGAATIVLPSTVTSLNSYVFYGCSNLTSIVCYAVEPPTCTGSTFLNFTNKDNCTVYVPANSVALYEAAEYWKDFTILPITDDAHVLQVNLPEDCADGRYKNNSIEIVNVNTGVRQKYVVTDRLLYTFNGLQKDEQYNVYLMSQAGLEIGCIENVLIPDNDIAVTFDELRQLRTIAASVVTPDGDDVTSQTTVEWYKPQADETTVYLRKAVSLGEVPVGQELICRITLGQQLGTTYATPDDSRFTVDTGTEPHVITLAALSPVTLSGKVVDGDGAAMSGASVAATQTFAGRYTKTFTTTTDRNGAWTIEALTAPQTKMTYSATECITVTETMEGFEDGATAVELPTVTLRSIVGARITYGFTYLAAGATEAESSYSGYQNVSITAFDVTQNRSLETSAQYPLLVILDENVNIGDEIRLTATSATDAFAPVTATATIGEDQKAAVTFDIVGRGGIEARFEMTENPSVTGMLYNAAGELVNKGTYAEAALSFSNLADGSYTLVTMGQSDLISTVQRLDGFTEIGLAEGVDYVKNTVAVESGKIATISISEVPAFDASLLAYTLDKGTSVAFNKSSVTTGNYLTWNSKVDFKSIYKSDISNVALVVDLPDGCEFVENSVVQGVNQIPYTYANKRLTIQLGNKYTSQVRFCVIPTEGGELNATGYVSFDLDGRTIMQPVGSAYCNVMDIELNLPSVLTKPTFTVTGAGSPRATVTIFDDETVIGQGKVNASGVWNVECELSSTYNLSRHHISATIVTTDDVELKSETKDVLYNVFAVEIMSVKMIHGGYTVVYDFQNPSNTPKQYTFVPGYNFTYIVEFTNNSPDYVGDVVLYVLTNDGKWHPYHPIYDSKTGRWVMVTEFSSNAYPVNVSLDYTSKTPLVVDGRQGLDEADAFKALAEEFSTGNSIIEEIFASTEEVTDETIRELEERLNISLSIDGTTPEDSFPEDFQSWSDEEQEAWLDTKLAEIQQENASTSTVLDVYSEAFAFKDKLNAIFDDNEFEITICDGLTASELTAGGYDEITLTDGRTVYSLSDENGTFHFVDFTNDLSVKIVLGESVSLLRAPSWLETVNQVYGKIQKARDIINDLYNDVLTLASVPTELLDAEITKLETHICNVSNWKNASKNAAKKLKWGIEETNLTKKLAVFRLAKKVASPLIKRLLKCIPIVDYLATLADCYIKAEEITSMYNSIPDPCPEDQALANACKVSCGSLMVAVGAFAIADVLGNFTADAEIVSGALGAFATGGTSLIATGWGLVQKVVVQVGKFVLDLGTQFATDNLKESINSLACKKPDDPTPDPTTPTTTTTYQGKKGQYGPYEPNNDVSIDPSGYVYEAVPTNRVEGVQASIYYKETVEDMYGDPYENIVLWDAEEYAQENPLFTDENGMYRWDVPQGLWQVKFEKDGYLTTYSEWLPVPPPQLDVNIAITQNRQPEVIEAHAYEEGVEVQFDKYMDPSTLTTANIYVTAGGEKVEGEITFVDSEVADPYIAEEDITDETASYVSRVRFVPAQSLSITTGTVSLTVSRNVLSYAGIPMTETYQQELDIEKEVQMIVTDEIVKVLYGGQKTVNIFALSSEAAAGRTMHIENASDIIATVDAESVTLDNEGKATITINGEIPGRTMLKFTIDDVTATGELIVDVVTELITAEKPTASRASGTAVYRGTKIELATDTKDGVIYFTTDGSCPCDENGTRRKYTVPIVINEDTEILAMTSVGNADNDVSEIATFTYTLKRSDMDFHMQEGWTWVSHNLETPVTPAELAQDENVVSILGQTKEVVRDPEFGLIGSLTELLPAESYKVETSAATATVRLSDVAYNPATPINVNAGWNWLGYTPGQDMWVTEAFEPTDAEDLDLIVGQDGFAQFDGTVWTGTLQTLSPGKGYMYKSQSAKPVVYNTSIVSKAAALSVTGISENIGVAVDKHAYPNVMCVVAELFNENGDKLEMVSYQLLAFCGSECRGIGKTINGKAMMSIYGDSGESIELRAIEAGSEATFIAEKPVTFCADLLGNVHDPYPVSLNMTTGVTDADFSGGLNVYVANRVLYISGIDSHDIDSVSMFNMEGSKSLSARAVAESGISVEHLPVGTYIVVIKAGDSYSYHKVLVR